LYLIIVLKLHIIVLSSFEVYEKSI